MTETKIVSTRTVKTKGGDLDFSIHSDGNAVLSKYSHGVSLMIHITREEAMQLSRNIEDVVSQYDAGRDDYHDQCDETPAPGTQEFDDCKGDYIYHQRSEE